MYMDLSSKIQSLKLVDDEAQLRSNLTYGLVNEKTRQFFLNSGLEPSLLILLYAVFEIQKLCTPLTTLNRVLKQHATFLKPTLVP